MATATFEVRLIGTTTPAPGTGTFRLSRPDGFAFLAGQFVSVTLDTREGEQTKHFSIDSAPADPFVEITTRLTGSAFKDALVALRPGDRVRIAGPRGRLAVPENAAGVVFLAGGVGITPVRSIMRDQVQRGTGLPMVLFYGNPDQDNVPFGEEFDGYAREHPEITVVHVLAAPGAGWTGETGFITADVVRRHIDPGLGWRWIVTGPPAMIDAMRPVLADLDVPGDDVSLESFAGYA